MMKELNERARLVLGSIVENYLRHGEATGSRTLAQHHNIGYSPATIRNVMADLEDASLLYSPHISSGRLPTAGGLKLFVDGILELDEMADDERKNIQEQLAIGHNNNLSQLMERTSNMMASLSHCASLVMAPTSGRSLKHLEFVRLNQDQALVVMVDAQNMVENRIINLPQGIPAHALVNAGNYISSHLDGRDLNEVRNAIENEIKTQRTQIDEISSKLVEAGLASWSEIDKDDAVLVVRGQTQLLNNITALGDLDHLRDLFAALEGKENIVKLLKQAETAEGVKIFIGSETKLFGLSDCSMIVAPYRTNHDKNNRIVGAIGVVGPLRMNYARIIPMLNYTADMVSNLMGHKD